MRFKSLKAAIRYRVKTLGGCRATARFLKSSPSYISRLYNGKKVNPSTAFLKKLGITEEKRYHA